MTNWQPVSVPPVHDLERGAKALSAFDVWAAETVAESEAKTGAESDQKNLSALQDPAIRDLIISVAGNSPFLDGLIARDHTFAARVFCENGDDLFNSILDRLRTDAPDLKDTAALMEALRTAKARTALLTAVMDIAGIWGLDQVTRALSNFAELALDLSVARLLHDRMIKGDLAWPTKGDGGKTPPTPDLATGSGIAIIAMGKLGGRELNYSSDIDLIIVYDEETDVYRGRRSLADCYVKLAQDLIKVMEQRTAHGYVFRTDLRLRPDPGATPLAISLGAAETYYQSQGRTWERSAMIKARVVAGDRATGKDFLERIRPFVWRRSLDFAAIRDIHDIKNRVHEHHRHSDITVAGQDVKLGRGGIREIEFTAQIHQLIAGGRETSLRTAATLPTLAAISALGRMSEEDEGTLRAAYTFLRTLEHRLQMIADEQTHTIPADAVAIAHVARFMGYEETAQFEADLLGHLSAVRGIYEGVLGETDVSDSDDAPAPALPDDAIAANLAELGFATSITGAEIVTLWRTGRYRALRTRRARHLLEACLGDLLGALAKASDPDQALARFDTFLSKLPAGVQIFSLLQANPWLFALLAKIMGSAPALAEHLARKPEMLDAVLDPGFFDALPDEDALRTSLKDMLGLSRDYQDTLDLIRRWLSDMRFQVGVQILEGLIDVTEAGAALALLADVTITELIPLVEDDFAIRHGRFPGGDLAVIAMGSYGGRGISYTSDLDLIFLYDADFSVDTSDGEKPLSPSLYFSRLGQHVITAITVLTGEGRLYDLDLRLRPSGSKGPLVVTLKSFDDYQQQSAWTWEHMALTRARIVRATPKFASAIQDSIRAALTSERDELTLATNVSGMHARLETEFGTTNPWAVKHVRGGVIDAEFAVQYLLLKEGRSHADIFVPEMEKAIDNLCALGSLTPAEGEELKAAVILMRTVQGLLRLCFGGRAHEDDFSDGLRQLLADQTGCDDFAALKTRLEAAQTFVYALYSRLLNDQDQGTENGYRGT